LGYDLETVREKEKDNDRAWSLRMEAPRISACHSNVPGIIPNTSGVIDTNLESQLQGLDRKLSKTSFVLPEIRQQTYRLPECTTDFNQIYDRSRFSENNHLSDIQLQRFDQKPFDATRLSSARRPSIGLDTRQFLKESWKFKQLARTTQNK